MSRYIYDGQIQLTSVQAKFMRSVLSRRYVVREKSGEKLLKLNKLMEDGLSLTQAFDAIDPENSIMTGLRELEDSGSDNFYRDNKISPTEQYAMITFKIMKEESDIVEMLPILTEDNRLILNDLLDEDVVRVFQYMNWEAYLYNHMKPTNDKMSNIIYNIEISKLILDLKEGIDGSSFL